MPFKSKAQQRFMFAQHPRKAKEWAAQTKNIKGLPEKLHPGTTIPNSEKKKMTKKAARGMFFEKRSQPRKGYFFRDMPGRLNAEFHSKTAMPGQNISRTDKPATQSMNVGATGAPIGGSGYRGTGMGGGMYGTGGGEKSENSKKRESDADRLKALLEQAAGGKERKAESGEKTAAKTPSEFDAESGLPTGFHRPAYEQPEALEPGGERFFSTEAKSPHVGTGAGLVEGGSLSMRKGTGHQMGKHASAGRFLGTSYNLQKTAMSGSFSREGAKARLHEAEGSLGAAGRNIADTADKGLQKLTNSPMAMGIGALLLARMGLHGAGKAGKYLLRGSRKVHTPPPGLVSRAAGSLKNILS